MVNNAILAEMQTNDGKNLLFYSENQSVLLVFLRHFGCIFCREALDDLSGLRTSIESKGVKIILVHMSDFNTANEYFESYNLSGITHVSDPDCVFYSEFGLGKGNFSQLFGLKTWARGFEVTVMKGIPISRRQIGDGFQMPGVFLVKNGEIIKSFIHKSSADRPNYNDLVLV
jgi:peroxiredoxin